MEELKRQREVQERANETITAQLEQLVLTAPRSEVPSPPPDIPPAAPESASPSREPRLPPPERFSGEESGCGPFLTQCSLIFELQPSSFPTDRSRIAYLMTVMSGRALTWASAVWEQKSPSCRGFQGTGNHLACLLPDHNTDLGGGGHGPPPPSHPARPRRRSARPHVCARPGPRSSIGVGSRFQSCLSSRGT
ncbi:hypothetical protein DPEC_G00280700 [Dallia pectoralis]|uniref:Uncharacterized protein n=1 Tax=Dallia pectoralis TaxID=75939 RepID=A0ACC2FMG3_DALPE|nr:hypothetical protein DPEC_G00280700 [Dallia pectoralis]